VVAPGAAAEIRVHSDAEQSLKGSPTRCSVD
jgi:hypothetical protein